MSYKVELNLATKAKKNRMHPELDKGDEVKIFKKRENAKERVGNFSKNVYTVEGKDEKIGRKHYFVEGMSRAYLRFELLTV